MTNFQTLDAAIAFAVQHPEQHDQDMWFYETGCGTTMCIAGIGAIQAGWTMKDGSSIARKGDDRDFVSSVAARRFELDEDARTLMFYNLNTIQEIIDLRNRLARQEDAPTLGLQDYHAMQVSA
jgi:hypothetical protein